MKFILVVRQAAVVEAGLIGKAKADDLCLLDYLRGWTVCKAAKTKVANGQKFFWLLYEHAIKELPLLFNPEARLASRKNQLTAMIGKLRKLGLIETIRAKGRLFFRFTDLAIKLTPAGKNSTSATAKSRPLVTPKHDEVVTPKRDNTVTSLRDEYWPAHIDETVSNEPESKETPPLSPCEGEAETILSFWNSFSKLLPAGRITPNRARKISKRLTDSWWRDHWREGIRRLAASDYAKGGGSNNWRATFDLFLNGDTLTKILEGQYDNRPQHPQKPSAFELNAQIKALDGLIAQHHANAKYDGDISTEQRKEHRELRRRREELQRQLAGVGKENTSGVRTDARTPAQARFEISRELEAVQARLDAYHEANIEPNPADVARERELVKQLKGLDPR